MMRLSGSVKFFWALASGSLEGVAALGPGFLRPPASRFTAASASALSLASAAALVFGSNSRLRPRPQRGLGVTDFFGPPLLVGDPIRHLLAGLVAAVQLVLLGVRRVGRADPCGDPRF